MEFKSSVKKPSISLILQDRRMIGISGRYFRINNEPDMNGVCKAMVIFSFNTALQKGHYFITVRIEDRFFNNHLLIIDKQIGALYFEVTRSGEQDFLGLVNIQIDCINLNNHEPSMNALPDKEFFITHQTI